jgi:MFS family permease
MHGLYLLWWVQERHVSAVVVAAILAAGDFALLLLEVPTGWLADRYGHRISLIVGSLVQVAGMVCCWLGQGVPGLLAASVLVALGDAFRSGADQALLFRTCAALGRAADFQRIEARTRAAQQACLVVQVLAGGAIVARWGFGAGWATETSLCAAGLALASAMGDPPPAETAERHTATRSSSLDARRLTIILLLIAPAAFIHGASAASAFLAQTVGAAEPRAMTLLVAAITLAEAAGSALAIRVALTAARAQVGLSLLAGVAILTAALVPSAFVPVVVMLSFLLGVVYPSRASAIQQTVADDVRAQAASLASACDMGVNLIALTFAGFWRSRRR